jgi:hypothetical protein
MKKLKEWVRREVRGKGQGGSVWSRVGGLEARLGGAHSTFG